MRKLATLLVLSLAGACNQGRQPDWVDVSKNELRLTVEVEGTLTAEHSSSVGPPGLANLHEYTIASMVPEGTAVKKGDVLLRFDPRELLEQQRAKENERDAAKTELDKHVQEMSLSARDEALAVAEAEAKLRKAQLAAGQSAELSANLELQKARLALAAAQEDVEYQRSQSKRKRAQHQNRLATLKSELARAKDEIGHLQNAIARMTVSASRAGTVIYSEPRWGGEKFKVGDEVWRALTVMEVATLDSMMAKGTVDEADAGKLVLGQEVRLRLEAHPDTLLEAKLADIGQSVQRKSRKVPAKIVHVKLRIEPVAGLQLRPGMSFRGEIEVERIPETLIVPENTVFSSPSGPVAYRQAEDGVERVALTLGKRGTASVQVLGGIEPGDRISRLDLAQGRPD